MKRAILSLPAGLSFDALTPEQQAAIEAIDITAGWPTQEV